MRDTSCERFSSFCMIITTTSALPLRSVCGWFALSFACLLLWLPRAALGQASVEAGRRALVHYEPERLKETDALIEAAIARGELPGAVLLVGRGDEVVYRKADWNRAVQPAK